MCRYTTGIYLGLNYTWGTDNSSLIQLDGCDVENGCAYYNFTALSTGTTNVNVAASDGVCEAGTSSPMDLFQVTNFAIQVLGPISGLGSLANDVISGQQFSVSVTAQLGGGGITATYYTGTVHLSSTDTAATLPADYTFMSADQGTHTFNVTLKTVAGTSATRDLKATDSRISVTSTQNINVWFNVIAIREGLVGNTTSTGHVIVANDHFVALPSTTALNGSVLVLYQGQSEITNVLDAGPWCPHPSATSGNPCVCGNDSYWTTTGVPFALDSCSINHAGIDLADGTFYGLGLSGNTSIYWRYQ